VSLPTRPPTPAPLHDLSDAEFAELDDLLAETPEPLEPLDVVMLDGYLCGVIVQPVLLETATWLAHVFDFDGRPLPDAVDPRWRDRITALIQRRYATLNRELAEDGWFEPLVLDTEDNPEGEAGAEAQPEPEPGDPAASLGPIGQALMPWAAGFQHAAVTFPDLDEMGDETVMTALARLYRHLPAETPEERELVATLDREHPLATLDDAIEDVVATVADLYDLTTDQRYKVETVRREAPKVGRNDPCPCGSGRKFKQCHGAA
jgi:uncharacterized protein